MTSEPRDELRDEDRAFLVAEMEAGERAKERAQFEDMGYDECETCRRARLRDAFRLAAHQDNEEGGTDDE